MDSSTSQWQHGAGAWPRWGGRGTPAGFLREVGAGRQPQRLNLVARISPGFLEKTLTSGCVQRRAIFRQRNAMGGRKQTEVVPGICDSTDRPSSTFWLSRFRRQEAVAVTGSAAGSQVSLHSLCSLQRHSISSYLVHSRPSSCTSS